MEMHVIGPRSLHSDLKALISGAKNLQLKSSQSVATPLETVIDTHYLSGVTTVGSIREMGLGTVGDPADPRQPFWPPVASPENDAPIDGQAALVTIWAGFWMIE